MSHVSTALVRGGLRVRSSTRHLRERREDDKAARSGPRRVVCGGPTPMRVAEVREDSAPSFAPSPLCRRRFSQVANGGERAGSATSSRRRADPVRHEHRSAELRAQSSAASVQNVAASQAG